MRWTDVKHPFEHSPRSLGAFPKQVVSLEIHHARFGITKVTLCGCEVAIASRRYDGLALRATAPVDL
jgi:hypothetical protein